MTAFRSRANVEHDTLDLRRRSADAGAMPPRGVWRRIVLVLVRMDRAARARLAVAGQEMRRDAVDQRADLGVATARSSADSRCELAHEQLVARDARPDRLRGTVTGRRARAQRVPQRRQACARRRPRPSDPPGRAPETDRARSRPRVVVRAAPRALRGCARARAARARARCPARCLRKSGKDPQRLIERLLDEPRHLGLVGHVEPGIDVRLERKLAQQRQAERVDRADGDVAEPIAQLAPSRRRRQTAPPRRAAREMIRSRISAAALRVNVIARMFAGSTPAFSRLM